MRLQDPALASPKGHPVIQYQTQFETLHQDFEGEAIHLSLKFPPNR